MEPSNTNNNINAIKEAKKLLNELRSSLFRAETRKIGEKLYKKEVVYNFLKEKEQKGSLTNEEKIALNNINKYFKNINKYFKNLKKYFKKDLEKLQKYNTTCGLKYLFNEPNEEDYYEPTEIKSAFDDSYILYESRGDKDAKLSINEYFDIIRPYLIDMTDNYKAKGEWKIQLIMQINFISSLDTNESHTMHTKSDNIEIMSGIEADDVINELLKSFFKRSGRIRDKNERE